jgi:hypothetical protein
VNKIQAAGDLISEKLGGLNDKVGAFQDSSVGSLGSKLLSTPEAEVQPPPPATVRPSPAGGVDVRQQILEALLGNGGSI